MRWPTVVCALGRSTHPADADRSQDVIELCPPASRRQNSRRYGGATPWMHFDASISLCFDVKICIVLKVSSFVIYNVKFPASNL